MRPGYKLVLLLKRRAGIGLGEFSERWRALHAAGPVEAPGLARHVHDALLTSDAPIEHAPPAPYDGAEELWFDTKRHAVDWVMSGTFQRDWLRPRLDLLAEHPHAIGGAPVLLWEQGERETDQAVKILTLPNRRRGMTRDEFRVHWTGRHAELALAGPDTKERLMRLEDLPADDSVPSIFARAPYDGVGAITFRSPRALRDEFAGDHYRQHLALDELRFTDAPDDPQNRSRTWRSRPYRATTARMMMP